MGKFRFLICGILYAGIAFAADPFVGTWKLRTTPLSTLASRTLSIAEISAKTYHASFDDVDKKGGNKHMEQIEICDGKEHKDASGQTEICQPVNALTLKVTVTFNGTLVAQVTRVVSADGKVQTVDDGKHVTTYDRQ